MQCHLLPHLPLKTRFKIALDALFTHAPNNVVGVAISGGPDSVFLAHMINALQIPFVAIHCNYQLRDADSLADEDFVRTFCASLPFCSNIIIRRYETASIAKAYKMGIQETARKIRYDLFLELYDSKMITYLATAHHADDQLETFFLHIQRKSGLKGLRGIPSKRDFIIRPMLPFRKSEILQFLNENNLPFRLDASNEKTLYQRNKIRVEIIPLLEEKLPNFSEKLISAMENLQKDEVLLQSLLSEKKYQYLKQNTDNGTVSIDFHEIKSFPQAPQLLYAFLDDYGFSRSDCTQILQEHTQVGAQFHSETHRMLKTAESILVAPLVENYLTLEINKEGTFSFPPYSFSIQSAEKAVFNQGPNQETVDLSDFPFPLTLRNWQEGDYIYPLGMKGKKLLSDFFTDQKINVLERKKIPLLTCGKEVLWIAGYRISNQIKVTKKGKLFWIAITKKDH